MSFQVPIFDARADQKPERSWPYKLAHAIGRRADKKTRRYCIAVTAPDVLAELGCSVRTAQRAYAELKRVKWVTDVVSTGRSSAGVLGAVYGFDTKGEVVITKQERQTKPAQGRTMRRLIADE